MENRKKTNRSKGILAFVALLIVVAAVAVIYKFFGPASRTTGGEKTITVEVVLLDGSDTETTITTEEEYLRGALEQEGMIAGEEGDYGLFVTTVNGVAADESAEQWWCFSKDGVSLETGVDSTPIADGDHFEITLTEGY